MLQNFSVAISVSSHICFILVLILISMFLRKCIYELGIFHANRGWSGGAMVLGELPVPGPPTIWIKVGQGRGLFGHFYSPLYFLSSFSLSLGDGPI